MKNVASSTPNTNPNPMLAWFFLIAQLGFAIYLIYFIITFISGAPFVPSTNTAARAMIDLADLKKGMIVYDLGSGDGRLVALAVQKGARAIGLEINPILVLYSKFRSFLSPARNLATIRMQSFWKTNLKDADVVFVYLLPLHMNRLEKVLKKQLKPGALIVSNSFVFPHWKTLRQDTKNHVYVFQV
jgi:SAM-dependent methyltransferase